MHPAPMFDGRNCADCRLWKPFSDFHRDRKGPGGRRSICKACVRAYQKRLSANPCPRQPAASDQKHCPSCGITKTASEFGRRRGGRYLKAWCRQCEVARRGSNPDRQQADNRRTTLRRYYGMKPEDYDALLAAQGGVCATCGRPEPGGRKRYLCVDHDHATGAVRGLLCSACNTAVGFFRDNPERLARMIEYLRTHSERPPEAIRHFATSHARR